MNFIIEVITDFFADLLRPESKKQKEKADKLLDEAGLNFDDENNK